MPESFFFYNSYNVMFILCDRMTEPFFYNGYNVMFILCDRMTEPFWGIGNFT